MIPIEKNIVVVDEQGNYYEATYPKRVKGLVKNGRARFIDENTICLACPPKDKLEDKNMSENRMNDNTIEMDHATEVTTEKFSMNYCLEQMEKIISQTEYLHHTIQALSEMKNSDGPDDLAGQARGQALGDIVKCREATNQRLIAFYEKMYDDLKPKTTAQKRNASPESIAFFRERFSDPKTSIEEKGLLLGAIADLL